MINKPKKHSFGIDCNVFYSSLVYWDYRHEHERRKQHAAFPLPNKLKKGQPMLFRFFFLNFCNIAYIICNPVFEINKPKSQPKTAVSHNVNAHLYMACIVLLKQKSRAAEEVEASGSFLLEAEAQSIKNHSFHFHLLCLQLHSSHMLNV